MNPRPLPRARTVARSRRRLSFGLPPQPVAGPALEVEMRRTVGVRAGVALGGLLLVMGGLITRAGWLMTVPNPDIEERGRELYQAAVDLTGDRGAVLDRRGRILAYTVQLPALYVNATKFPHDEIQRRAPAIAELTGHTEEWVKQRLGNTGSKEFRLGGGLDPVAAKDCLDGLTRQQMWTINEPVRLYPGKESAAPLLGYTEALGAGAAGLERLLDDRLAGETHTVMQARDRKDRSIDAGVDPARLVRPGRTVRLTIDAAIQDSIEHALDKAVEISRPEAAMGVVMDIHTGAILAMASRPSGNPNDGAARADQELFKNHAAMDQLEPGSVMKPFVVAAALEEGLVTPGTMMDCELGHWVVGDKVIKDDHPKGVISVSEVIKFSSNIGTAKVGFKLGAEKMLRYLADFGFSRTTGLNLPGEVRGQMRRADNIRPIELATTAFGQGVTASPVQLVSASAALANGGVRMMPYLVDAVLDPQGEVEELTEPRVDRRIVSEETAREVAHMMESVTEEGGTGTRARVVGYGVAGKTGTAQKVEGGVYSATKRVSSFVGFLPVEHPEIAIAIVVDSPTVGSRYGGIVSAPVFAEVGTFTMRYLGIPQDSPEIVAAAAARAAAGSHEEGHEEPVRAAPKAAAPKPVPVAPGPLELVADGQGGWILPDLTGRSMRGALEGLALAGLALQTDGYGRVAAQEPVAGSHVAPGDRVFLRFD